MGCAIAIVESPKYNGIARQKLSRQASLTRRHDRTPKLEYLDCVVIEILRKRKQLCEHVYDFHPLTCHFSIMRVAPRMYDHNTSGMATEPSI